MYRIVSSIVIAAVLNTLGSGRAGFENSHAKTTGPHVALRACNSSAKSDRELFKSSKGVASLVSNENFSEIL